MQAIKVQIYFSEWEKVSDFISEINIDEEMAAYAIDNRTMVIATVRVFYGLCKGTAENLV